MHNAAFGAGPVVHAQASITEYGEFWIQVPEFPVPVEHAWVVAEEMLHVVLWAEGYPVVQVDSDDETIVGLASDINTTYTDPLIHARLQHYDLYTSDTLIDAIAKTQVKLDILFTQGVTARTALRGALCYLEAYLDQRLFGMEDRAFTEQAFTTCLARRFPGVVTKAQALLAYADSAGMDTPLGLEMIMRDVRRRARLDDMLVIKRFTYS